MDKKEYMQFRSDISFGISGEIDREKDIIHNVAVVTKCEAKGHNVWINDKFLDDFVSKANKKAVGIKVRFGHPNASSTALGTYLGRMREFYRDSDVVRAQTFHLDRTSHSTPNGDLGRYVMDLAESDPEAFGSSIVFKADQEYDEKENKAFAILDEIYGCDVVDDPAANPSGLFNAFAGTSVELSAKFTEFLDKFLSQPTAVQQVISFLQRYNDNREYYKQDVTVLSEIVEFIEETEGYVHVPAPGQEGKHKDHKIRTIWVDKKEGIQGRYCIDCKKIISYLFDKSKGWTKQSAKKWVDEHNKEKSEAIKDITEEELSAIECIEEAPSGETISTKENEVTTDGSDKEKNEVDDSKVKSEEVMNKCSKCGVEIPETETLCEKCKEAEKQVSPEPAISVDPGSGKSPETKEDEKVEVENVPVQVSAEKTDEIKRLEKENNILRAEKIVDGLMGLGKITPAFRDKAIDLLILSFDDTTLNELVMGLLNALPEYVVLQDTGRIDPTETTDITGDKAYSDTEEYAREHQISFKDALKILRNEGKIKVEVS